MVSLFHLFRLKSNNFHWSACSCLFKRKEGLQAREVKSIAVVVLTAENTVTSFPTAAPLLLFRGVGWGVPLFLFLFLFVHLSTGHGKRKLFHSFSRGGSGKKRGGNRRGGLFFSPSPSDKSKEITFFPRCFLRISLSSAQA